MIRHLTVALAALLAGCQPSTPPGATPTSGEVPVAPAPDSPRVPLAAQDEAPPLAAFTLAERAYAFTVLHSDEIQLDALIEKLQGRLPEGWTTLRALPEAPPRPAVLVEVQRGDAVKPPSPQALLTHSRGLDAEGQQATSAATGAVILSWLTGPDASGEALKIAHEITAEIAAEIHGHSVWDETTLEAFSLDAWRGLRLGDAHPGVEARRYVTVRMVADPTADAPGHLVSAGMSRFGLPDVVITDVSPSEVKALAPLLDLICQALVEGQRPTARGDLSVDLPQHLGARSRLTAGRAAPTGAVPAVGLRITPKAPGDPENRLVRVVVPQGPGEDLHTARLRWLSAALGAPSGSTP